jgi:hypothetical protein
MGCGHAPEQKRAGVEALFGFKIWRIAQYAQSEATPN